MFGGLLKRLFFYLFAVLLISQQGFAVAPISFNQSSSSVEWKTIENDFVKVIYPETFKDRAVYVANLIEHYSAVVGLTYGITKPKKLTLIIRDEMAQPNGYVTLGPRRSEWFDASDYTPIVGSTEWLQTLSIHEYRHVQQFDDFNKNSVRYFDYLFGDLGQQLASVISRKSWFFEGDAVYTETKYTDAGRGRSPRHLARLKALLLGAETPTYDQFISGTYKDSLVNQYVYGYILISRGYQKYGEDFWGKMNDQFSRGPHPWRLERSFRRLTGETFKKFYYDTFQELRTTWAKDAYPELAKTDYQVRMNPKVSGKNLYYVQYDLESAATIFKETDKGPEKIMEIPYSDDLMRLDFSGDSAVYSEFMPHPRFNFKGYSNLVLVDLKDGSSLYITANERLYNPHFSHDGKRIIASEFTTKQEWQIQEFDLAGERTRTLNLPGLRLTEAAALDNDRLIVLAIDTSGNKSLIAAQFGSEKYSTVLAASRNNIFGLQSNTNSEVLFEAQYKGATEVIKVNVDKLSFAQCTKSRISAYAPTFDGASFYYSEQIPYGNRIQKESLDKCTAMPASELVDFKYLGDNPSDNYNKFAPTSFTNQPEMYTKNASNYPEKDYGSFDARAFTPHSWSFFVGRGFGLSVTTDNYLGDFGGTLAVGSSAEENTPFTHVQIDYKKYWPVISLLGSIQDRSAEVMGTDQDLTWREGSYGLGITLPFQARHHLYSSSALISYQAEKLHTETFELDEVTVVGAQESDYLQQSVSLTMAVAKDLTHRSIISPWSTGLFLEYQDASGESVDSMPGAYRTYGLLSFTTPGIFANNGVALLFSGQKNKEGTGNYLFPAPILNPTGYVYSRGFEYKPADEFSKASFNYLFPIIYPDINLGAVIYVNRVYGNLYVDHTKYVIADAATNLNSFGAEVSMQTVLFRFLPLEIGIRYFYKLDPDEDGGEIFLANQITMF
jgi:hypothetical protein